MKFRPFDHKSPLLRRFEVALENKVNVKKALLSFEKINGPILLISAEEDQVWPSYQMSNDILRYLKEQNFKYSARAQFLCNRSWL